MTVLDFFESLELSFFELTLRLEFLLFSSLPKLLTWLVSGFTPFFLSKFRRAIALGDMVKSMAVGLILNLLMLNISNSRLSLVSLSLKLEGMSRSFSFSSDSRLVITSSSILSGGISLFCILKFLSDLALSLIW